MSPNREHAIHTAAETAALRQMVLRFASREPPVYGKALEPGKDLTAAMRALLLDIDTTMLPRRIPLKCGREAKLTLLVSNRRLLAVENEGQPVEPVPQSPKAAAAHFAAVLRRFLMLGDTIWIDTPQSLSESIEPGVSVSAPLLARAMGLGSIGQDSLDTPKPTHGFDALSAIALASTRATSGLSFSESFGPESRIYDLQNFWRRYVESARHGGKSQRIKGQQARCVLLPVDVQTKLVAATQDEDVWCLALVDSARVHEITMVWDTVNR